MSLKKFGHRQTFIPPSPKSRNGVTRDVFDGNDLMCYSTRPNVAGRRGWCPHEPPLADTSLPKRYPALRGTLRTLPTHASFRRNPCARHSHPSFDRPRCGPCWAAYSVFSERDATAVAGRAACSDQVARRRRAACLARVELAPPPPGAGAGPRKAPVVRCRVATWEPAETAREVGRARQVGVGPAASVLAVAHPRTRGPMPVRMRRRSQTVPRARAAPWAVVARPVRAVLGLAWAGPRAAAGRPFLPRDTSRWRISTGAWSP